MPHADFYVTVATTIPVLVIVVVFQTRYLKYERKQLTAWVFGILLYALMLAGTGCAVAALYYNEDAGWMRKTGFMAAMSALALVFVAGVFFTLTDSSQKKARRAETDAKEGLRTASPDEVVQEARDQK